MCKAFLSLKACLCLFTSDTLLRKLCPLPATHMQHTIGLHARNKLQESKNILAVPQLESHLLFIELVPGLLDIACKPSLTHLQGGTGHQAPSTEQM
eukprot:CAMPEP_0172698490 /NCGR_PEP_ID=MMETSP1074-20121228/29514_1 /TAXON_ID=2916 /ORGANISM="Ceratium fusus, Strain PA161109" /LENGTH=95 /DNA_ID=CAMNT_0013519541 /DNA_START=91 /DNA_END=378 /DNA_ORIENTATION=-